MPIAPEYLHMVHPGVTFDALIYGRASRDPKKKGRSVGDQIDSGRDLCDAYGWPVAEVFDQDIDRSASRHARRKRKDFEALLAAIEAGKGRIVVAWEASRYYRDIEAYIRLRNACMAANVLLCYNGQVFDLSKREDRKATAQHAIDAEDEAEGIRDRVLRTTRAQAKKGLPHGRILWGYARRYDSETGDLIEQYEHLERGPIVRDIFQRIAAGETVYSIVKDLQATGDRLPGITWDYYHLHTMLRNKGYAGRRIFQGEDLREADWPAIVSAELFEQVQQVLKDPGRRTVRDWTVKHLLTGIARCGECPDDPPLRVFNNRKYLAYQCSSQFDTVMREKMLDAYVEEALLDWLRIRAAAAFRSDEEDERAAHARVRVVALERQLDEAREQASTFRPNGRPMLSVASLAALEERLEPLLDEARGHAQVVHAPALLKLLIESDDVEAVWEDFTMEQRRTALRASVNVRLHRARARGVRRIEPGRVSLVFRGEPGFAAIVPHDRARGRARAAAAEKAE